MKLDDLYRPGRYMKKRWGEIGYYVVLRRPMFNFLEHDNQLLLLIRNANQLIMLIRTTKFVLDAPTALDLTGWERHCFVWKNAAFFEVSIDERLKVCVKLDFNTKEPIIWTH